MYSNVLKANNNFEKQIFELIIADFTGQLANWWKNYLTPNKKHSIEFSYKKDEYGLYIIDNRELIQDVVYTLICNITRLFIGQYPRLDAITRKQLINLKNVKL